MSRAKRGRGGRPVEPRVPPAEQLLIDELPTVAARRIVCTTVGRGQFAAAAACLGVGARIVLHELDLYLAEQSRRFIAEQAGAAGGVVVGGEVVLTRPFAEGAGAEREAVETLGPPTPALPPPGGEGAGELGEGANQLREGAGDVAQAADTAESSVVEVFCTPDFPEGEFDLAALPVDARGEAELTRDLLQTAFLRLPAGGRLLSAVANPEDQWLHGELRKLFPKVTRRPAEQGVLYLATKSEPLRKEKRFDCEFAFRDQGRLLRAISRPGVFSHRSLDGGARALMNALHVRPGDRVLDLGCGSGVVAFAAACRAEGVVVTAIDSHARAVECTQRGAAVNGLTGITVRHDADGETGSPGTYDVAVANPPYFSDYRIAGIFMEAARRALRPGGRLLIVTKALSWYEERLPQVFEGVGKIPHKLYTVFEATQRT